MRPIIVGENALEFYTLGSYATADIDIVCNEIEEVAKILRDWDFKKIGRHWFNPEIDIAIEIPDEFLAGDYSKVTTVEIEGLTAYIIGIEDLIIDRLNACFYWKSPQDCEWVRELILLYKDEIDWEYLEGKSKEQGIYEALKRIKNEEN
ncbi:MAG TPA: DUF6036 family nucleotidyltransferase [Dictyoglomaceae bacterium]|nr:DUF6036 family nucleotidyltransferase [Dictyoglomaceae bacterium]HOL39531.1 DUF6036 family nucleotidyltransferase [Dictyoglomaceae bacterium]HOP94676.1 DUF6036 family nucleotidyltransferase [Dictyoglomaceae bacterium]HPP16090.1 DUF6036 family nucleotidyltransferase [Dictyoglomaceae bacterium]HPU43025.1 DUF6036 family nucleotidyltransferase [Dictyoglomaceae bacterium]